MILLLNSLSEPVPVELFRMMDFHLLFPACLKEMSLPRQLVRYKKTLKAIPPQFEVMANKIAIFEKLRHVQNNSLGCLVSTGFINKQKFLESLIVRTNQPVPPKVSQRIEDSPVVTEDWFKFLTQEMPRFPTTGSDGWKARAHLSEYRYDRV
jgi:hypothetical protein